MDKTIENIENANANNPQAESENDRDAEEMMELDAGEEYKREDRENWNGTEENEEIEKKSNKDIKPDIGSVDIYYEWNASHYSIRPAEQSMAVAFTLYTWSWQSTHKCCEIWFTSVKKPMTACLI